MDAKNESNESINHKNKKTSLVDFGEGQWWAWLIKRRGL
jgi:hypothetical protein